MLMAIVGRCPGEAAACVPARPDAATAAASKVVLLLAAVFCSCWSWLSDASRLLDDELSSAGAAKFDW